MLELLAPAGSMEALTAAVQNGADAVYLGLNDCNARRGAKNFTEEELASAVSYCHVRGVKVYLTLNTLLTDKELPLAAHQAALASRVGVDAALVQDLGVLRAARQAAPDLPLHASTQMSVHTLDGVKVCAELGLKRAVLARELSAQAIGYICDRSPIEIEVFGHGALCMCYSGQCYFSAVVGQRSGNRGMCAQPCRMKYGWGGKPDGYPLSLKDMCLAQRVRELRKLGVNSLKIEGRMRRAEYVAVVTRVYAGLIKEDRAPTSQELAELEAAFSREGFTQGYFDGKTGPEMFGVRPEKAPEPRELFAQARQTYAGQENPRVEVRLFAMLRRGEGAQVGVQDGDGNTVTAAGEIPQEAQSHAITAEQVEKQLSRTGGTPYRCVGVKAAVEPGLNLPLSAINALRRQVLDELSQKRAAPPRRSEGAFHAGARYENPKEPPALTVQVRRAGQVSQDLLRLAPAALYLPAGEMARAPGWLRRVSGETRVIPCLPRVLWDGEREEAMEALKRCRDLGAEEILLGNLGQLGMARELGLIPMADFGIQVCNAQALKELKRLGFASATASFELQLAQIRDLSKAIPLEAVVYGRLPLMVTENCIIKNRNGSCSCEGENVLTDRRGERFPVIKAPGCRNEILNGKKLFLADKPEWKRAGLTLARLLFTTENPWECAQALERYQGKSEWTPGQFTRGLYYRGVE